ncbi:cation transporter [Actinomycetospora sp. TBRC 11914]|uniref:cation transporter n=1 Tax=Actinomycetospora sp. TBRC 11914 TaxID=2729387 RepID=UPI00145E8A9C|nr:cation transporter [Actinomycetospora sp. TBRC 11914]NMO93089.1 cation transporter [Actinomycetospora sp. TBRC 11914]
MRSLALDTMRSAASLVIDPVEATVAAAGAGVAGLRDQVSRAVGGLLDVGSGRRRRHVWTRPGHAHIEVRGLTGHGTTHRRVAHAAETAVGRLRGVRWADVNGVTGQLLVAFDPDAVTLERLVAVVEASEQAVSTDDEEFPWSRPNHPADPAPLVASSVALAGDVLGMGAATAMWLARAPALPNGVRAVVGVLQAQPRLRRQLERWLGPPGTEFLLGVADAVVQAGTQDPGTLAVDAVHRVMIIAEVSARRAVWAAWEPTVELSAFPPPPEAPVVPGRDEELPAGAVETYAELAAAGSLLASTAATLLGRPGLGAQVSLVGMPRAARLGREAFAATLARGLTDRGMVPLDGSAYRRLDRITHVVLDLRVLPEAAPGRAAGAEALEAVMEAAQHAGTEVSVVAPTTDPEGLELSLATRVRQLQADGHGVLLLAAADDAALEAADVAVAIWREHNPVCWAADLISDGLEPAIALLGALPAARRASRRGVALALAGSSTGLLSAVLLPGPGSTTRALLPVHVAGLAALVSGHRTAALPRG